MAILFLTDPSPDYLADLLYIGLSRVLGHEQVIDFPPKPAYHRPESRVHYIPQVPSHKYRPEDVAVMCTERRFELGILSSPRSGALGTLESMRRRVPLPPLVLIDGEDDSTVRHRVWRDSGAALYFKRELKLDYLRRGDGTREAWWRSDSQDRVRALPLSVVVDHVDAGSINPNSNNGRVVDVSYAGRLSHPKRKQAVEVLAHMSGIRFEGGVYAEPTDRQSKLMTGLPRIWTKLIGDPVIPPSDRGTKLEPQAYYELLRRSKMALSVRGGGFDTLRYWEVVATKTLLLSEEPDIHIPDNFVHGEHALFFKPDLSDLTNVVQMYAKDEQACSQMAQRGYDHLLQYHTCERRAEYVLELCRRFV
jgi:hypothetical protein